MTIKRIISSVCAICMLATMSVTSMVAHAEVTVPVIKAELKADSYNSETGEGEVVVSISGINTGEQDLNLFSGFQTEVMMGSTDFDTSLYTYHAVPAFNTMSKNVTKGASLTALTMNGYGTKVSGGIFVSASQQSVMEDSIELFTFKFKVSDPTKTNTISLQNTKITVDTYSNAGDVGPQLAYLQTAAAVPSDNDRTLTYSGDVVVPGNKTDDGGDDEGDTNAPVQVGGGVIEDTVEDSKDAAVAYTQKFTAVEGYKVRWNLTCNKVGEPDKMINGSYTYTIANIETEGDVNIGLIVQYDPSVYENVVVTDGAIVTE